MEREYLDILRHLLIALAAGGLIGFYFPLLVTTLLTLGTLSVFHWIEAHDETRARGLAESLGQSAKVMEFRMSPTGDYNL